MKLLLDTHLLLWTIGVSSRLSSQARLLIDDFDNTVYFSAISIWEIAIKSSRRRTDFLIDPTLVYHALLDRDFKEAPVTGDHALQIMALPHIHGDPFDRLLVAQAMVEGLTLLTTDGQIARYPGPIKRV